MRNFTTEQLTAMKELAQEWRTHKISTGEYHVRLTKFYED
jgi:hypothetical protein